MLVTFSFWTLIWRLLLVLLTVAFLAFLYLVVIPWRRVNSYKRGDTVISFSPIMGFIKTMRTDFVLKGDILANSREFGKQHPDKKFLVCNIGNSPAVLLRDTQYIKDFFQKQNFYKKAEFAKVIEPLMSTGLVMAEGEAWKRHRKMISGSFNYELLKSNVKVIQKTTREFLDSVSPNEYQNFPTISKAHQLAGEILGRVFFGENIKEHKFEGKTLTAAIPEVILELIMAGQSTLALVFGKRVMNLPFFAKYAKAMRKVEDFRAACGKVIEQKKIQKQASNDLLSSLIATQASSDPNDRFTDDEIIDEFVTFFVAGMDTTSQLVGMTLYHLSRSPKYLDDLKKEREATYNKEQNVTAETLQKMEMLHAVLKETLRLHTPSPIIFPRIALQDHEILDFKIRKGTIVRPDFMTTMSDERHFESPEQFKPDRWISSEQKLDPYAFIPFSAGPRSCIGQNFAIMEAKIIISELLNKFSYNIDEKFKLSMTFVGFYRPAGEIMLHLSANT